MQTKATCGRIAASRAVTEIRSLIISEPFAVSNPVPWPHTMAIETLSPAAAAALLAAMQLPSFSETPTCPG